MLELPLDPVIMVKRDEKQILAYNIDMDNVVQFVLPLNYETYILYQQMVINYYKKKQVIFSEGNCSRNLYFIKKGKVKTYQTNDYGKQLVVDLYAENDFIGYIPLLENTNYTEAAEALEETELLVIPRGEFNNLIKTNPEIMRLFMNLLTKSVSEKKNQMIGLAYNSLRKKVAEALVIIYTKYKADQQANFTIDISSQ